ncbi:MAG TPA: hypothetical protein VL357_12055 [Rariglobus sp.]|jgi:hypothetical protein|nr:hypothetical protein [Rariglobus sp.]
MKLIVLLRSFTMQRALLYALLSSSVFLSGCIIATPSPSNGQPAAYGSGVGYINGAITVGPMNGMPSLESRGVKKLALIFETEPFLSFDTVGLTVFGNDSYKSDIPVIAEPELRAIFIDQFTRLSSIGLIDITSDKATIQAHQKFNTWNGKASLQSAPDLDAKLTQLRAEGIDGILFVKECRYGDFIGMTDKVIGAKGLYHRFKFVCACDGFWTWIIDLKTLKEMPHTSYTQAMSQQTENIPWKESFADYSPDERAAIAEAVRGVFRANVSQMVTMLKAQKSSP